jgi:hypothetical protein
MSFDPYYEWLGIPPDEQPADQYRLLGIRRFESNSKVIENAAERQLLLLKTFQNGPHGPLTQRLMNEVSAARVCLLHERKRAEYDAELKGTPGVKPPPRRPPAAGPFIADTGQEDEFKLAPPSPDTLSPVSQEPRRVTKPIPRRRTKNLAWASLGIQVAIGGVAAVCVVVVALWMFWGRDPFNIWQRGADQRELAQTEDLPNTSQERQSPRRPSRGESTKRPCAGKGNPYRAATQTGERTSSPPDATTHDDEVQRTEGTGNTASPFQEIDPPSLQPTGMPSPLPGDVNTEDPDTTTTDPDNTTSSPSVSMEPQKPLDPFSELLGALDIPQEISGSDPTGIVLGKVPSTNVETWQIDLEDYAALLGSSRFEVGQPTSEGSTIRWPLLKKPAPENTVSGTESETAADASEGERVIAHVEADNQTLAIRFANVPDADILQQLGVCCLNFAVGNHRHTIQLSAPQRMSPLEASFSDSKQEVVLDKVPALSRISLDRLVFELVQASFGQESLAADLKAELNEELLVTLDAELECQLGVRLLEKDEEFRILLTPRTTATGRREPLVRLEIEKELARAKTQLVKNRRELVEANSQLRSLPSEIRRVQNINPGTPQEASMRQGRLNQLEKIGKSLQSKVRRLAEADPKMMKNIEQLDQILQTITKMSGQVTVQFRIYARGNSGDFEVLQATTQVAASLSRHQHLNSVPLLANGR